MSSKALSRFYIYASIYYIDLYYMFIFSILLHFNDFLAFVLRFESEMCGTDMPKVGINLQDFSDGFAATQFSAFIVTFVAKAAISELLRSAP